WARGGVFGTGRRHRVRRDHHHRLRAASVPRTRCGFYDEPARRMSPVTVDKTGVRIDGVSKRFAHRVKGEVYAVRDVRLDVRPGEFLTLLGPSGCGKTTTLRMIAE